MAKLRMGVWALEHWNVACLRAGRGAPVVLLHGSGDTAWAWKGVVERLAEEHEVLAIDFGESTPTREVPHGRMATDRDLLEGVLGALDAPAHLAGHSYGALLALRFALDRPGALRSLCLTEPIAFGLLREESSDDERVVPTLQRFLDARARGDTEAAVEIILDYWNGRGSWRAMPAAYQARILGDAERFHQEVACAFDDRTRAAEVRTLAVPTLVASGERTTDAALRVCDILAAEVPGARALRIEGAGHSAMRTHPDRFSEALVERFSALPSG